MDMTARKAWEAAFRRTTYRAYTPKGHIDIRIGEHSPEIPAEHWAFITAFNPLPEQLSAAENLRRHEELVGFLTEASLPFCFGDGIGDDATWQPETSVLILGISRQDALALAVRYGQVAFVYGKGVGPSELIWTGL